MDSAIQRWSSLHSKCFSAVVEQRRGEKEQGGGGEERKEMLVDKT